MTKTNQPITKSEVLFAEYCLCLLVEAGVAIPNAIYNNQQGRIFQIIKTLIDPKTQMKFKPDARIAREAFLKLHQTAQNTGTVFTEFTKEIIRSEEAKGYCKNISTRTSLRCIALGIGAGLSPQKSIVFELGNSDLIETLALTALKKKFKGENLDMFFDFVTGTLDSGANVMDLCLFVAGSKKL